LTRLYRIDGLADRASPNGHFVVNADPAAYQINIDGET